MRVTVSLSDRESPTWEALARCLQYDAETMWPADGDRWGALAAKAVCVGCEVRAECLETALAEGHVEGVWGGLTPLERRHVARGRRTV